MKTQLVYSEKYDLAMRGFSLLHPFDGKKFSKAWTQLLLESGEQALAAWLEPKEPVSNESLLKVHDQSYLSSLSSSKTIAKVVEIWSARFIPNQLLTEQLLHPIRLACAGTVMGAQEALKNQSLVMNFGGGYHHAFADHGEGFCFFADAALSIIEAREAGLLAADDKVLMIDVDAHRGNGFEALMGDDAAVANFDMYNFQVYPGLHHGEPEDYPIMIPLKAKMGDERYLTLLQTELDKCLAEHTDAKLVFYNAGNDVLASDPLGGLQLSVEGVVKRDQFVIEQLVKRQLPTVIMTSGGYTKDSYHLIAELAKTALQATA